MRFARPHRLLVAGAMTLAAACSADGTSDSGSRDKARPTEPEGHLGMSYGTADVRSFDSDGGFFRVWYALDGEHRVRPGDEDPANGVPDFVEYVASTADDVLAHWTDAGWAQPPSDTVLASGGDDGGDGRYDIYLVDFDAADGLASAEVCTTDDAPKCSSFIAMENDFARSGYATPEEGVTVLVSHEFFHSIQNAYNADLPPFFSEGTATWAEEAFFTGQDDFERLADYWLEDPDRSLNSNPRRPGEGFQYGAAIFFYFLDLTVGADVIRGTFEGITDGTSVEEALDRALDDAGVPMSDAWLRFGAWTLFTGDNTIDGSGFPNASEMVAVELEQIDLPAPYNWQVSVDHVAIEHVELEIIEPVTIELRPLDGWATPSVAIVVDREFQQSEAIRPLSPGEPIRLDPADGSHFIVVANSDWTEDAAAELAVRASNGSAPEEPEGSGNDPEGSTDEGDSGGSGGGCAAAATVTTPWLLLPLIVRRRRTRTA